MIKQTITYTDYNDKEQSEDFYFNLNKLEVMEMEISFEGGLQAHIERLTQTTAGVDAYYMFKDIILASYGTKSLDGRTFIKNDELKASFEQSPALAELIFGFLQDGQDAAAFIKGVLPAKLVAEAEADAAKKAESTSHSPELSAVSPVLEKPDNVLRDVTAKKIYTKQELLDMSEEEFAAKVPAAPVDMTPDELMVAYQRKNR